MSLYNSCLLGLVVPIYLYACGTTEAGSAGIPTSLLTATEFAPGCVHPAVRANCVDGWCRIPSGCFLKGSPETEPERGAYDEDLTAVTLTRPFIIEQHEFTQAEWATLGLSPVSGNTTSYFRDCFEPNCSAGNVNWLSGAYVANYLSEHHKPPLPPCYRLINCVNSPGGTSDDPWGQFSCDSVELTAPTVYECEGFRLSTEAEWEYAARAGTLTAYYSGDVQPQNDYDRCFEDKNLDAIGWYCKNAADATQPVMRKRPNAWGLYDMLGNNAEWVHDPVNYTSPGHPVTDPYGEMGATDVRMIKGGMSNVQATALRAASRLMAEWNGLGGGLRLVRTLQPDESWPPKK